MLTSQSVFIPKKMADGCGGNSGITGVLNFAVPLFNVVIQILQQNPVQNKFYMLKNMCENCIPCQS